MAMAICMGMMLDMKHLYPIMKLPYGTLQDMMKSLGLKLLTACEGTTTEMRSLAHSTRLVRCQAEIGKLRQQ